MLLIISCIYLSLFNFCYPLPVSLNEVESEDFIMDLSELGSSIYGQPSEAVGELLLTADLSNANPEELGSYLEGDILIPRPQSRNGMIKQSLRWPDGRIPYVISDKFNRRDVRRIKKAIEQYHIYTCIKLEPKEEDDEDYIEFTNERTGCWSSVGKIGGRQEVNIQEGACTNRFGTIVHEIMHAVGFMHEQNRPDRDDWVAIKYDNIRPGVESNFHKLSKHHVTTFQVPYDYNSVMHYNAFSFSKNGEPTIVPLQDSGVVIGQRKQMSELDIQKINKMYKCEEKEGVKA